jgi:hypothetical protein
MICFRTNMEFKKGIEKYALDNHRNLSSAMEFILLEHLRHQSKSLIVEQEQRRFQRKPVKLPAFINVLNSELKSYQPAVITDLSLNGLKISVPKDTWCMKDPDNHEMAFNVMFVLPEETRMINIQCKHRCFIETPEDVHVGAMIVHAAFKDCQSLQKYLL